MKRKKFLTDPAFWILAGINIYLVYHYYHFPEVFTTLIWLYWCQSMIIGIFASLDILTTPKDILNTISIRKPQPVKLLGSLGRGAAEAEYDEERKKMAKPPGAMARSFILLYAGIHLLYLPFIATMKKSGPFQTQFFMYFFFAFLAGQIITFVQHKVQQRKTKTDDGRMFSVPYLRILPTHLTIVLPTFLHLSNMTVFLILKSFFDLVTYIASKPKAGGREMDAANMVSQQSFNT